MSLKKVLLKNTTRMSLHERFTYLRSQPDPSVQVATYRQGLFNEQQASSRNRRLAYQMERRPAVMAALKLKKKSLRQRLGQVPGGSFSTIKDRLSLTRGGFRGRGRGGNLGRSPLRQRGGFRGGRGRGGSMSRSQSNSNLSRSQSSSNLVRSLSTQSLNSRNMSNGGGGRFRGRSQPRNRIGTQRSPSLARQNFRRGRGGGRGSPNRNFRGGRRGSGTGKFSGRGQRPRGGGSGFRNRGSGRGRSRGGRMGRDSTKVPTKEELDDQLDQYMANTKVHLDKDLDNYMNQGGSDLL